MPFRSVLIVIMSLAATVWAEYTPRSTRAIRTATAPVIDGKLDDACWQQAPVETDFTNYKTLKLAEEQTQVRVLYDDTHLYVAYECLEPNMADVVAFTRIDDRFMQGEDLVQLRLDTFHDRRCCYCFEMNTFGTRRDFRYGLFSIDTSWSCEWSGAVTTDTDRWYAEFCIPIANLLFKAEDDAVWGANFRRFEYGKQEISFWNYQNSRSYLPRGYGLLTDLDLSQVQVSHRPSFETYLRSTTDLDKHDTDLSTGLDMSLRVNANSASAFTINPDYGQVEADADTIELRDTERFLPERRAFFREGSELFQTPIVAYYSRRLSDIDAGGKLTGQDQDWSLGLVQVYGQIHHDNELKQGHQHAGRLTRYVGDLSHVGGIWTWSERPEGRNVCGGMDTRLFLTETTSFTAQGLALYDSEVIVTDSQTDNDATAFYTSIGGGDKPIWWDVYYRNIGRGFRPDLGYVPRRNIAGPGASLRSRYDFTGSPFLFFRSEHNFDHYQNDEEVRTLQDLYNNFTLYGRNQLGYAYTRLDRYRRPYQNWANRFSASYNRENNYWQSVQVGYEYGTWQDNRYREYRLDKPIQIAKQLTTQFGGSYRNEAIQHPSPAEVWLFRSVTQYNFGWGARFKFTYEDTSEDRHNITALYTWPIDRSFDFYFLYNDYRTTIEEVNEVFAKIVWKI